MLHVTVVGAKLAGGAKNNKTFKIMTTKQKGITLAEAGSLQNYLMSYNSTVPEVGQYCTELMYSDRRAWKVIEVGDNGLSCIVQLIDVICTDYYAGDYEEKGLLDSFMHLSFKKGHWGIDSEVVEFTPLINKLYETDPAEARRILENNNVFQGVGNPLRLVPGLTKIKKVRSNIKVIFSSKFDHYVDPHF